MGKKRNKKGRKGKKRAVSWKRYLGIGADDKWKSGKDYRESKRYWKNGRLQAIKPAGYEDFKRREKDYLDNKKNQRQLRKQQKPDEEYSYGGRGSGEFEDIRNSLREDAEKGRNAAADFKEKTANVGKASQQNADLIRDLRSKRQAGLGTSKALAKADTNFAGAQQNLAKTLGVSSVDSKDDLRKIQEYNSRKTNSNSTPSETMNVSANQRTIAKLLGIQNIDSQNDINQINRAQQTAALLGIQNIDSQNDIKQIRGAYDAAAAIGISNIDSQNDINQIREYNGGGSSSGGGSTPGKDPNEVPLMQTEPQPLKPPSYGLQIENITAGYNAQINAMQQQLQSAAAAQQAAEQRALNMRNAFVPQANPSAMSVAYGDQRRMARNRNNNQLSDLTIMSGLGTASNPLAGLQLA